MSEFLRTTQLRRITAASTKTCANSLGKSGTGLNEARKQLPRVDVTQIGSIHSRVLRLPASRTGTPKITKLSSKSPVHWVSIGQNKQAKEENHSPLVFLGSRGGAGADRLHGEGRHGWMDGAERWGSIWGKPMRRGRVGLRLVEGEKTRITHSRS